MPGLNTRFDVPPELTIGTRLNARVPENDQRRQRSEVEAILNRLRHQPGVVLADEVGMGKTFVALGVAYAVASRSPQGPVIVMVPPNLIDKWVQDLRTFCDLYLEGKTAIQVGAEATKAPKSPDALRFGVARDGVALMKLLDDPSRRRAHIVFLGQGALARAQTDSFIRLALIAEALRTHGRGGAKRLINVKKHIHRYLGELLWALGEERRHGDGTDLWRRLLAMDPEHWRETLRLADHPVPKMVARAIRRIDLKPLATALEQMPVRARGGKERVSERVTVARHALREVERSLWRSLLASTSWRSPLLVMDEAHHLKNPNTSLARQFQSLETTVGERTGDGAMARAFDRMLFLTATPFQLGHHELVNVLRRFGDVRWDGDSLGELKVFIDNLGELRGQLDDSQCAAIAFQKAWSRLDPPECAGGVDAWWARSLASPPDELAPRVRAVMDALATAKRTRTIAERTLQPWVMRHNKGTYWDKTKVARRNRLDGGAIAGEGIRGGLPIGREQMLPFFLAARSAVDAESDVLGAALASSYESFRFTRRHRRSGLELTDLDEASQSDAGPLDLAHARWYLAEFDRALADVRGATHPKIAATVRRAVDLWEAGEKVLVFAFYLKTCRALRFHISEEIRLRLDARIASTLPGNGAGTSRRTIDRMLDSVHNRFFDEASAPGRRALDQVLAGVVGDHSAALDRVGMSADDRANLVAIMRRFLRAPTTLVRSFPLDRIDSLAPDELVTIMLDHGDASGTSWRQKFHTFLEFLTDRCSSDERRLYLEAASRTQTGHIRVENQDDETEEGLDDDESAEAKTAVANVQVATGKTKREARSRLMRAFNTPFFPDILVCSEVMSEGVDLQRFCRHVIHHDLAWNPSTIEQRTGRVDRLGCKAEGSQSIVVYVPYLAGTADERQYKVMSHREQWFRVVMGQDEVAKLIGSDSTEMLALPKGVVDQLSYRLSLTR